MKPLLVLVAAGLLAAAVFGAGQLLGAWDDPPAAGGPSAEQPTVSLDEAPADGPAKKKKKKKRTALPASVVRKIDALCRGAHRDALAVAAQGRPTTKKGVRRLFEQLHDLNERYNGAALEALARHADDRRVRTLARLFERDERLLDGLIETIPVLDSPAGQARFEQDLATLQRVGRREERVFAALGVRDCDTSIVR